mmetsp:Transcript_38186/g.73969  ORF Transcript_38186/g.73969 Transcript_38186/m.73969 type:complete len:315 (+) Transcript_38186:127-1071(+)
MNPGISSQCCTRATVCVLFLIVILQMSILSNDPQSSLDSQSSPSENEEKEPMLSRKKDGNSSCETQKTVAVVLVIGRTLNRVAIRTIRKLEKLNTSLYTPLILYDADKLKKALLNTTIPFIAMRRQPLEEYFTQEVFRNYSGRYRSPAKSMQIRWLASQTRHRHAWFIEGDVFYNGDWQDFLAHYFKSEADLIMTGTQILEGGNDTWFKLKPRCDAGLNSTQRHGLISIHRMSKRLSVHILNFLLSGRSGHHECVVPTICDETPSCSMEPIRSTDIGYYGWSRMQAINVSTMKQNALYHPVKRWNRTRRWKRRK